MLSRLRPILAALFLAGCCVVLTAVPAQACSCLSSTTQTNTKSAEAVFTGTVTAALSTPNTDGQRGSTITHDVTVERVYKGDIADLDVQVATSTGAGGSSCGLGKLTLGKEYMFFAQGDTALWTAEGCSGTAPASDKLVTQVVRLLGDGRPPMPPEPQTAVFTNVSDGDPATLTRAAAPGVALVLVGLLGLLVVRRLGRRA